MAFAVRLYGLGGVRLSPELPSIAAALPLARTISDVERRTVILAAWADGRMIELMMWQPAADEVDREALRDWMRARFAAGPVPAPGPEEDDER